MSTHTASIHTHESLTDGEFPAMALRHVFRKPGVFLVQLGERFALVDATDEQVVLLNQTGAWLWSRLGSDDCPTAANPPQFAAFLGELQARGLLGDGDTGPCSGAPDPTEEAPRVLGSAPLQVAANNSGDPFAATGW